MNRFRIFSIIPDYTKRNRKDNIEDEEKIDEVVFQGRKIISQFRKGTAPFSMYLEKKNGLNINMRYLITKRPLVVTTSTTFNSFIKAIKADSVKYINVSKFKKERKENNK